MAIVSLGQKWDGEIVYIMLRIRINRSPEYCGRNKEEATSSRLLLIDHPFMTGKSSAGQNFGASLLGRY
jgi:hypothetical protein